MKTDLVLSPALSLPLDAVTRTFGIFGQRGTGKSTTAAVIVEQAVKQGGRCVVLDPTGVWWGLTHAGAGPGLSGVVLGGENADAPLEPTSGHLVAEFVIGSEYALVVLDLKLMRKHQRQHFAMEFLEALYHGNRDPLLVVMDEAAQFAPTHMREGGDLPRLLGAVEDVVKLGRSRGLGVAMIEQRFATLNANVREQIETLIAHRLIGPLDRKALKAWVAAQGDPAREAEAIALVSKAKPGTALVWSPAFLEFFGQVEVNNATTFDSRATPKVGERRRDPGERAKVDLDSLRSKMAVSIEEAKANDPVELRKIIRGLEANLAARVRLEVMDRVEVVKEVPVPVLSDQDRAKIAAICQAIEDGHKGMEAVYEGLRDVMYPVAMNLRDALDHEERQERVTVPVRGDTVPVRNAVPDLMGELRQSLAVRDRASTEVSAVPDRSGITVTASDQKILDALAWYRELGVGAPSRTQVGLVSGYKQGGRFNNILSGLKGSGLIEYAAAGMLALTEVGSAVANYPNLPRTSEALQQAVLAQLPPSERKVLDVLIANHPNPVARENLALYTGYSPGGRFNNIVSGLKSLGLVGYPGQGSVVALDVLFPTG